MQVQSDIEPPGLDLDEEGDDEEYLAVIALIVEVDETRRRCAALHIDPEATDDQLADALITSIRGVAAMRGQGLVDAVERRLR